MKEKVLGEVYLITCLITGKQVERKETCPACGKLICWNMMNKHLKARHEKK